MEKELEKNKQNNRDKLLGKHTLKFSLKSILFDGLYTIIKFILIQYLCRC